MDVRSVRRGAKIAQRQSPARSRFAIPKRRYAEARPLHKTDMEFLAQITTNDRPFLRSRIVKTMRDTEWGRVIAAFSSMAGLRGLPVAAAFTLRSKHGLLGLIKSLARTILEGPRLNAICPGYVDTPSYRAQHRVNLERGWIFQNNNTLKSNPA